MRPGTARHCKATHGHSEISASTGQRRETEGMRILKRVAVAAAVGLAVGALALGGPAQAQAEHFPVGGWAAIDTGAGGIRSASTQTTVVASTVAGVTWVPGDTASALGTSLETPDVGLPVKAGDTISVDFVLLGGADPAGESVRLFYYSPANADTWAVGPTAYAAASDDGSTYGTLTITVAADGVVGTLGMVYDTSNGGVEGTVRFTDLTVAGTLVLFVGPPDLCEVPGLEDLLASDRDCRQPDPAPSPTAEPTTGPSTEPIGAANDDGGQLPMTGVSTGLLVGGAVAVLALGGLVVWLARRRRISFTA